MVDYEKLYHIMLDASEKAIEQIERQNYGMAAKLLQQGEQDAEEWYVKLSETEKGVDYQNQFFMLLGEVKYVLALMRKRKLSEAEGALLAAAHCAEDDIEASKKEPRGSAE